MSKVSKIKIFVFSTLILLFSVTCRKDSFRFSNTIVYASLDLISDLGTLGNGGIKIYPPNQYGDIGGLIIYLDYDGNYYAFDAACTYDFIDKCYVKKSDIDGFLVCPCCNSTYQLYSDGNDVFKGPARYPLVQYSAFVHGGVLIVRN